MKYTFDRVVRLVIALAVIVGLALLVNRLSGVLLPFLIGWLLAYLIHPLVKFVQYKMRVGNRGVSIAIALLFIAIVIVGLGFAVVPAISAEIMSMHNAQFTIHKFKFGSEAVAWLAGVMESVDVEKWLNPETVKGALESLLPSVKGLVSGTWDAIASVFVVFVVFLYVVFILIDYEKINRGAREMIPPKYRELVEGVFEDLESGMNRYFRGQSLVALIVGVMFAIGFKIVGLPMAITVGLFIGVLNLVPYLQTVGVVPVVLLCLVKSAEGDSNFWLVLLGCFIVFLVVQGTQDLFLVPKIMGKAMGLNPAVILLSLSVWGSLLGIVGMIIALPFTTLLISYYKRFVLNNEELGVRSEE
ncbi:MAG: AI-2E family transporter [Paludibacteraceae bacterium]|nr:AI-2E family transporter [Paludibacteraceae bacterium]